MKERPYLSLNVRNPHEGFKTIMLWPEDYRICNIEMRTSVIPQFTERGRRETKSLLYL